MRALEVMLGSLLEAEEEQSLFTIQSTKNSAFLAIIPESL
jgi:hypothetical protein